MKRRLAALLLDIWVCLSLTFPVAVAWIVAFGIYHDRALESGCSCDEQVAAWVLYAGMLLLPLPSIAYALWTWTAWAGGRSVGQRVARIRPIAE